MRWKGCRESFVWFEAGGLRSVRGVGDVFCGNDLRGIPDMFEGFLRRGVLIPVYTVT